MDPLVLQLTDAGLAAVQAASGTDQTVITELGLTATAFDFAPTLEALPGEFKRLDVTSGVAAAPNIAHLTVYDTSTDTWSATGFALFLEDGTLFAAYTQADPVLSKASLAFALLAMDISFASDLAANIAFGDAIFTWPPATETTRGIAKIATQELVDAEADDATFVTPKKLADRLAALLSPITDAVAAVTASLASYALKTVSISGGGLVGGGGDLTANRTLTVTAANSSQLQAAASTTIAVTPSAFGGLPRSRGTTSYEVFPGGTLVQRGIVRQSYTGQQSVTITFPVAFANTNYDLQVTPVIAAADNYDDYYQEIAGTRSTTSVQIFQQDPSSGASAALAGFNWRAEGEA